MPEFRDARMTAGWDLRRRAFDGLELLKRWISYHMLLILVDGTVETVEGDASAAALEIEMFLAKEQSRLFVQM